VLSSTAAEAGSRGSALFKVKLGLKDVQNFIPGNRVNARSWLPFSTFQKKKKSQSASCQKGQELSHR
jgi:hypothetical protein